MPKPVIISCAVTGSLHTPSMSPHLPVTPAEIATAAIGAAAAGAAIIHLHARDPQTGRPSADPALFLEFLREIRQASDAVLNLSTGGAPGMTMDERLAAAERASPEMASLNMGSLNVGLFRGIDRMEFRHEWERPYLAGSRNGVFRNTFADIETILNRLGKGHGCRFEFECYDVSHLSTVAWCLDEKLYDGPIFIQFVLGVFGGIPAEVDNLLHMVRTAQRLFGVDVEISVLAAGRHQMAMCTHNALLGGNVRVGLEDNLRIAPRELATSNAQQVLKIRRILEKLNLDVATPAEVRHRLALKGAAAVGF